MIAKGLKGGQLSFFTKSDLEKIHLGTIEILEKVGLKSASKDILKTFADAGAYVDFKAMSVKIPEHLIKEALKKAPKQVVIYGRNEKQAIVLENKRTYFGLGGTPTPHILDVETGEIRRPGKRDVAECTKLGDALPNMDFIMTIAGAFDVPYEVEYLHEWEAMLNNTTKPIVYPAPGRFTAQKIIEMGIAILGNKDELMKKPPFGVYVELPSPLMFHTTNENIFELAKAKVPIVIGQMPQLGATAPVTHAGAAVISNSENLAALTLTQLVNPGAPFVFGAFVGLMDPRTGRCAYGSPEFAMGNIVCSELASYYNLPSFGWGGCSDSKLPDAQAGAEAMMNTLIAALTGINLIHDYGYLAGGSVGSMEMAYIGDEAIGMAKRIIRGIRVDDETLAIDVIKSVGPEGNFLAHPHTLRHLREEIYVPRLFDRASEVSWIEGGKKELRSIVRERVKKILAEHKPEPLPKNVQEKIRDIVKSAEKQLLK